MYAVVSCSLDYQSKSARIAKLAYEKLTQLGLAAQWVDLRDFELPLCNGSEYPDHKYPDINRLKTLLTPAQGIIIASSIYNWDVNAAAKNLVELMNAEVFKNKIIGFIGVAAVQGSFLAPLGFLNSLMVDFQSVIVPKFVFASHLHFKDSSKHKGEQEISAEIRRRTDSLVMELVRFRNALASQGQTK